MTIKAEYDPGTNIFSVQASGKLTSTEIRNHLQDMLANTSCLPGFIELVNLDDVEDFALLFSDLDLEPINEACEKLLAKGHRAVLVRTYNEKSRRLAEMILPVFRAATLNVHFCNTDEEFERLSDILLNDQ